MKPQDDFNADEVRFRETIGSPTKIGYQTAITSLPEHRRLL